MLVELSSFIESDLEAIADYIAQVLSARILCSINFGQR
jgi:hypothetical protein